MIEVGPRVKSVNLGPGDATFVDYLFDALARPDRVPVASKVNGTQIT